MTLLRRITLDMGTHLMITITERYEVKVIMTFYAFANDLVQI